MSDGPEKQIREGQIREAKFATVSSRIWRGFGATR